jgi:hypothetical protein
MVRGLVGGESSTNSGNKGTGNKVTTSNESGGNAR